MTAAGPAAGWHPDPIGRHEQRYWDGEAWSEHVSNAGVADVDPLPAVTQPAPAAVVSPASVVAVVAPDPTANGRVLGLLAIGAVVAVLFGAYGRVHDPTNETTIELFFSGTLNLKVWFTSVALLLGLVQILTALRMYGKVKIPKKRPRWLGDVHRLSGTLAFVFTLPVAFHCLWALGFESSTTNGRQMVHSVAGCFFYGVFVIKVLAVRVKRLPGWLLPVAGSAAFAALAVLWATSSLWFFQNVEFPGI